MAAHVAQEELQRVARHEDELIVVVGRAWLGAVGAVVSDLDSARFQALVKRVGLFVGQLELLVNSMSSERFTQPRSSPRSTSASIRRSADLSAIVGM